MLIALLIPFSAQAQSAWEARLDGRARAYQQTDFGVLLAVTERSLYALDNKTGETLWRRGHAGLDETAIAPVPGADLILLTLDAGDKSRLLAIDQMTGEAIWQSEKVRGDVMQLAVAPEAGLLAAALVKKARGRVGAELKRKPALHIFDLATGREYWKKELDSDVELMPANFTEDGEVSFTLDNYRAPLFLDGKLYLFYEGITIFDARSGKEIERERFKVNEDSLALTEAEPTVDEARVYLSGHGKLRAVSRRTGRIEWEAKDLGVTPETFLLNNVLYARTGGQFTRIKDGETTEKGASGISALDARTGKTLWRYKGADKGLTNFVFADENTVVLADRDDLVVIDARTGKRAGRIEHKVSRAQFVIVNERGQAVVGGKDTLTAFNLGSVRANDKKAAVWSVKYSPPGRGAFRIIAGIALRATALYFRYGGLANSAFGLARGAQNARSLLSLRWSGLKSRFSSFDLMTLAGNSAANYLAPNFRAFGVIRFAMNPPSFGAPSLPRLPILTTTGAARSEAQEKLLDRLDPARQLEKLSDFLLRRQRLSQLRGQFMYFYTDLPKPYKNKGLAGVNVQTGETRRLISLSDPDPRFFTDEAAELLYSADGNRLLAYSIVNR